MLKHLHSRSPESPPVRSRGQPTCAWHINVMDFFNSSPRPSAELAAGAARCAASLRLGSGGVVLPNYAPLAVVEQFGMLEELHPSRIDLGLGRSSGADQITFHALRG
jgi:alkanesulfonate monooxygenase SsuD/methylene tetrahydromethanopterin reductase-like flavin-dependent oxidoreductase (luciferase family)